MERRKLEKYLTNPRYCWSTVAKKSKQKILKQVYWKGNFTKLLILSDTDLVYIGEYNYINTKLENVSIEPKPGLEGLYDYLVINCCECKIIVDEFEVIEKE